MKLPGKMSQPESRTKGKSFKEKLKLCGQINAEEIVVQYEKK